MPSGCHLRVLRYWRIGALVTLHLCAGPVFAQTSGTLRTYPVAALQQDLAFLKKKLFAVHPDPYMYTSPERLERCFDSLRLSVDEPLTELRFLSTIAALYPLLSDGHTMFLPGPLSSAHGMSRNFLPLNVAWLNDRLYVRANGSSDDQLAPGREIVSINGTAASAIMDTMLRRQIRDGFNTTYPIWILSNWFKEYYRFSFGESDSFSLVLASDRGPQEATIAALPSDSIRANMVRRVPAGSGPAQPAQGIALRFLPGETAAVLTIPTFEAKTLRKEYGQNAKRELVNAFSSLNERQTTQLILDLRGNQGGDAPLAKLLLSYLINEPFSLVADGPSSGVSKPEDHPFNGDLFVLMNGGCFSVTGMVLSCLERHHSATFIGEEAGGNRTVLAGSPKRFRLPNTQIDCWISTKLWQLNDQPNDGHGVRPTLAVRESVDDLLTGRDAIMEEAKKAVGIR